MTRDLQVNKEPKPVPTESERGFVEVSPAVQDYVQQAIYRRLIPLETSSFIPAINPASVKQREVFILGGTVKSSSTITTVASTGTQTNLNTFTFLAREFYVGMAIRLTAFGTYSTANATDTVTLRIGAGNAPTTEWNSIVSTAATVTNVPWNLTFLGIVGSVGTSGTLEAQLSGHINNVQKDDANTATVTLNSSGSVILALTATWSAADIGNTISIRQFLVEVLN